jgi:hypothetical protein
MTLSEYFAHQRARRRARLLQLIDSHGGGKAATFATRYGFSEATISQYLSEPFRDGGAFGDRAARMLEEKVGLPFGWLDAGTPPAVGPDEPLRTRMLQLAGEVAAAKARAASDAAEQKANFDRDAELRKELSKARARNYDLEQQVLTLFGQASKQVDHAAELRRAITETRIVFESEPAAGDVLNYLESVLAAGAPVPAQTEIAGGGGASSTEETHAVVGSAPGGRRLFRGPGTHVRAPGCRRPGRCRDGRRVRAAGG